MKQPRILKQGKIMHLPLKVIDIVGTDNKVINITSLKLIQLRFDQFSSFSEEGFKKTIDVRVKVIDLLNAIGGTEDPTTWNIPLDANVRRPSKNKVVDGILATIKKYSDSKTPYTFPTPIYLLCTSAQRLSNNSVQFDLSNREGKWDGILDGGHKIFTLKLAEKLGLDLKNLYISVRIFIGYDSEEITALAIALNTSKQVKVTSLYNYQDYYAPIKRELADCRISYFEGDTSAPKDIYCSVTRILCLLRMLDITYNPENELKESNEKRHPIVLTKNNIPLDVLQNILNQYGHLLRDAVNLQTDIAKELEKRYEKTKNVHYITRPKNSNSHTKLPTGETINCKLPSYIYILPILSAFKVFLSDDLQWNISMKCHSKKIIRKLVTRLIDVLQQDKYSTVSADGNIKNSRLWDIVWNEAVKYSQDI